LAVKSICRVESRGKPSEAETAIHEAGHAVIGRILLGMICGGASIVGDGDRAGHAVTGDPWAICRQWYERGKFRHPHSGFVGRIMTCMAGAEAAVELAGSLHGQTGDGEDRYQIALMFEETGFEEDRYEYYEGRLRRFTRYLVRRHRDKINRVAEALLARGRLTAEEIDDLAGPNPNQDRIKNARAEALSKSVYGRRAITNTANCAP
jgi:hypothetical protein